MVDSIILGTIGIENLETPVGKVENVLGGSAIYASFATSLFSKVGIISILGEDFPSEKFKLFKSKEIDVLGLQKKGKTFRWDGSYSDDMNTAKTNSTEINCLNDFVNIVPEEYKSAKYILLGNFAPQNQLEILTQFSNPELIVFDTMNYWIKSDKIKVLNVIKKSNLIVINDQEIRNLFGDLSLRLCAKKILESGPDYVIIKKGEHGAILFSENDIFSVPGYPLEKLVDPTGCGDAFAGTILGYISKNGNSLMNLKKAMIYASAVASFNAQDFSTYSLEKLSEKEIQKRYHEIENMLKLN